MASQEIKMKIVVIGDLNVGKTSLLQKYIFNKFDENVTGTRGMGFNVKTKIVLVEGRRVCLRIFHTSESERLGDLRQFLFRHAACCILVYDVVRQNTFESLKEWRRVFLEAQNPERTEDINFIVLGNKVDLLPDVDTTLAEEWCASLGMSFFKTSAKTGENLEEVFEMIAQNGKHAYDEMLERGDLTIQLNQEEQQRPRCFGGPFILN